jgi:enoyl-CoA hydratase/carnithine racemase
VAEVELTVAGGIATVRMEDRAGSNTFTPALVGGLSAAFGAISRRDDVKAVVLHGYDTVFCAGGACSSSATCRSSPRCKDTRSAAGSCSASTRT